jgi:hypothetical protein
LVDSKAFEVLRDLLLSSSDSHVQYEICHTLYRCQNLFPDYRDQIAALGLAIPIVNIIGSYTGFTLIAPALLVLAFCCESMSRQQWIEFARLFPIPRIYEIHLFVWHERHPGYEIHKVWSSFGYLHILHFFCCDALSPQEFQFVLTVCQFIIQLSPNRYDDQELYDSHYWQLFRYVLAILNVLTKCSELGPDLFREYEFHIFVNAELTTACPLSNDLACSIWTNLLERGDDASQICLDSLYDLIDRESGPAAPAAMRLIASLISHARNRAALVTSIACGSTTCKPLLSLLAAKDRSFDALSACADCLIEIFRDPSPDDLRALASAGVVEALAKAIRIRDTGTAVAAMRALTDLAEYARDSGGTAWETVAAAVCEWEAMTAARETAEETADHELGALCTRLERLLTAWGD